MEKCEGEARVNKEKIIFFYEWKIILNWTGYVIEKENEIQGKFMITLDKADTEIEMTNENTSPEGKLIQEIIKKGMEK